MIKYHLALVISALGVLTSACDVYHKNRCEWYLVPEPEHVDRVEPGWVALCARNYVVNRQRCNLKAKLSFAKAVAKKPFRYNSMRVKPGPYPKEVERITICES